MILGGLARNLLSVIKIQYKAQTFGDCRCVWLPGLMAAHWGKVLLCILSWRAQTQTGPGVSAHGIKPLWDDTVKHKVLPKIVRLFSVSCSFKHFFSFTFLPPSPILYLSCPIFFFNFALFSCMQLEHIYMFCQKGLLFFFLFSYGSSVCLTADIMQ